MTSGVLFVGGEDFDLIAPTGWSPTGGTGASVSTTSGTFRSGYARCSIQLKSNITANPAVRGVRVQTPTAGFSASSFWTTGRLILTFVSGTSTNTVGDTFMSWRDSLGRERLRVRNNTAFTSIGGNTAAYPPLTLIVEKLNAAGTATQIGSLITSVMSAGVLMRIDVFINYAVSGSMQIYLDGGLVFSVTATDLTTDGITSLGSACFGMPCQIILGNVLTNWSEMAVTTGDSREILGIVTQAPAANGNVDTWTGSASDVNEIVLSDTTVNYTMSAAQLQQYTVGSLPSGVFGVLTVATKVRAATGAGAPTKIDHSVRTGGVDYLSSDVTLSR